MAETAKPVDVENSFRDSLKDQLIVMEKLQIHCLTLEECIGMVQLATTNDGQLRMLLELIMKVPAKK